MKRGMLFMIICLMAVLPAAGSLVAAEEGTATGNDPIRITAGKMEVKSEKNVIIFEKNVIAVQGDITINADKLRIVTESDDGRKVKEMTATGNVQFRQFFPEENVERYATGEKARYWDKEGKLVMTGAPKAWENDNIITGETMTFYTRENLFIVDGEVKVVFYPDRRSGGLPGVQAPREPVEEGNLSPAGGSAPADPSTEKAGQAPHSGSDEKSEQ